jgi:cytochrome c-type biogenesis protein CcmH/NrfF
MRIAHRKSRKGKAVDILRPPVSWVAIALALGLGLASLTRADAPKKPTLESIGDQVMCLCGCVATLNHCPHRDCATVAEIRPVILQEIAAGKDETTILQDLAIRYGVQVLAAPPAQGFSLTAWILPSIGLLAGLSLVVAVARRWRKPGPALAGADAKPLDPKLLAAVEEEMKAAGMTERD